MVKFCQNFKMAKFCHVKNVSILFTNSYVGDCHLGEMAKCCHLEVLAMAVEMDTLFVTQMLARFFLAGALSF
jgi:hypothetical protein